MALAARLLVVSILHSLLQVCSRRIRICASFSTVSYDPISTAHSSSRDSIRDSKSAYISEGGGPKSLALPRRPGMMIRDHGMMIRDHKMMILWGGC